VASTVITPQESMWMAGYAARDKPSEGKVHDLHAKALALEDATGTRLVLVTLDLITVPRDLREWLETKVGQELSLPPEGLYLNASHTHCGPGLRLEKKPMYDVAEVYIRRSDDYADRLQGELFTLVKAALADLQPAELSFAQASADFAMNRRSNTGQGYQIAPNPNGPVDHDVPVLRVADAEGKLRAVLFGYACHNTTLSFNLFCGDYAGFAQADVEAAHPGATALFMIGCGGDQNPEPRRSLELARQHGKKLAMAVDAALGATQRPVHGPLRRVLEEIALPFDTAPTREELQQQAKSDNKYARLRAETLLKSLEADGKLPLTYPYLVHVVQFGGDLTMVGLAGEVVVDYSLRLKRELADNPLWVAGYTNDVFGYVPSARIVKEGGYEGGGSVLYTARTAPFPPTIEAMIVDKVHELVGKLRQPPK
jgi:hypothetical protein